MADGINYDAQGEPTYDQWAVGDSREAYIYMTRDPDELFECERDRANIVLGRAELDEPYAPR